MPHRFDPSHLAELDRPDRAEWQSVDAFLKLVEPRTGFVYADIGCGTGYFAIPVAELILPDGKVYGLDVQPEMIEEFRRRVHARELANAIALLSKEQKLPLPNESVDGSWTANAFHEFEAPLALLYEVSRILKPGGRALVIDWKPIETPMGPPLEERVTANRIREALRAAGFSNIREHEVYRYHSVVEGAKRGGKR